MKKEIQKMGVINITPNSFSDGGQFFGDGAALKIANQIRLFYSAQTLIIDIGAESTAPINSAVSQEEESLRFQFFFSALDLILDILPSLTFSIDTYRFETFNLVLRKIRSRNKFIPVWWNDISGKCFEQAIIDLLKSDKNLHYIYCHNLAPTRNESGEHIKFIPAIHTASGWENHLFKYFLSAFEHFEKEGVLQQIIFDPCFGFSKGPEDNFRILDILPILIGKFQLPWVLGISRKSFLKKEVLKSKPNLEGVELLKSCKQLETSLLARLSALVDCGKIIERTHWQ